MITPIIMLAVGLLLVFVEFFVPGGILGVAGGVLIILSIILFAVNNQSITALLIFMGSAAVLVVAIIRFALWKVKHSQGGRSFYLNSDQEGYSASVYDKSYIGKEAVTLSDLKPAGHILVEGKRFQAVSKTGYILKGKTVAIIGGRGAHFIVKKKEE